MLQHQGIWFPDGEVHLIDWMNKAGEIVDGKGTYQIKKLRAALAHVTCWEVALDVGAHVGLWSRILAPRFKWLWAFEPVPEHRACFRRNVEGAGVLLQGVALGERAGRVSMRRHDDSSGNTVVTEGDDVPMFRLDDLNIAATGRAGFVKIDVEGYEHNVVAGGEALIRRDKPVIIVEQKPHVMEKNFGTREPKAVRLLERWGYRVRQELSGDFILTV